jgi:hypothetical protein
MAAHISRFRGAWRFQISSLPALGSTRLNITVVSARTYSFTSRKKSRCSIGYGRLSSKCRHDVRVFKKSHCVRSSEFPDLSLCQPFRSGHHASWVKDHVPHPVPKLWVQPPLAMGYIKRNSNSMSTHPLHHSEDSSLPDTFTISPRLSHLIHSTCVSPPSSSLLPRLPLSSRLLSLRLSVPMPQLMVRVFTTSRTFATHPHTLPRYHCPPIRSHP